MAGLTDIFDISPGDAKRITRIVKRAVSDNFRAQVQEAEFWMEDYGHTPTDWRGTGRGVRNECAECGMAAYVSPDGRASGDAIQYNCDPLEGV